MEKTTQELLSSAIMDWAETGITEATIVSRVDAFMQTWLDKVVLGTMGLERSFGSELRIRTSHGIPIAQEIKDKAAAAAIAWVNEYLPEMPSPNDAAIIALQKEYSDALHVKLRYEIRDLAESKAHEIASEIVQDLGIDEAAIVAASRADISAYLEEKKQEAVGDAEWA